MGWTSDSSEDWIIGAVYQSKGRVLDVRRMGSVGFIEDGRVERMNAMSDMNRESRITLERDETMKS